MKKNIIWFIALILLIEVVPSHSQWSGSKANDKSSEEDFFPQKITPINIIDTPTANFISRKHFELNLRVYHMGGMLGGLTVGLTSRLMIGIGYGGQNIIGQGPVKWNQSPGVNIRYQIRPEYYQFPSICIGFDSQGYGTFYPQLNRYQIKSKGAYLVLSKNYALWADFGIHGGINYSGENSKVDKDINFFCGAHLMLDPELTILWEYDFATNDNDQKSLGSGKGYMNAAVRWNMPSRLVLEFSVKNLLGNIKTIEGERIPSSNRELKIIYYENL